MVLIDPLTDQPLPPDSIQRVLYNSPSVHVYNIPPLTSNKGYTAASWTENNNKRQIFTARLRVLETAIPLPSAQSGDKLRVDILLEDPNNSQLFAAAPFTQPEIVQQAIDSSRFFAVRVQGDGGRKATLGVGFEDRSDAFDFRVLLQEVTKTLGFSDNQNIAGKKKVPEPMKEEKRDFSLKEGEMVVVNIGKDRRRKLEQKSLETTQSGGLGQVPVSSGLGSFLPPPPSAEDVKKMRRSSMTSEPLNPKQPTPEELGFDNGEFGEFQ
ncbi:hypothetical protein K3495_g13937 [Podosphaera aphanis]|nr:hypothetical protein K3495_g13937 [Podosphaera aphanis]